MMCPPLLYAVWRRVAEPHQMHAEPWQSLCQRSSRRAFVLYAWRIIPRHAYSSSDGEHTTGLLRDLSPLLEPIKAFAQGVDARTLCKSPIGPSWLAVPL